MCVANYCQVALVGVISKVAECFGINYDMIGFKKNLDPNKCIFGISELGACLLRASKVLDNESKNNNKYCKMVLFLYTKLLMQCLL